MADATISRSQLSRMIDHSVLSPQAGLADLEAGCQVARKYAVASLCVKPYYVRPAARRLAGSGVMVGATVGFPHGAHLPAVKAAEAAAAFADGADEVDMVINIGALRDGEIQLVREDIHAIVAVAGGHCVKVILECALLDDAQKRTACQAACQAGANFVKMFHRLCLRRRHRGRRGPAAGQRAGHHAGQGGRRHPHAGASPGPGPGRRDAAGNQRDGGDTGWSARVVVRKGV